MERSAFSADFQRGWVKRRHGSCDLLSWTVGLPMERLHELEQALGGDRMKEPSEVADYVAFLATRSTQAGPTGQCFSLLGRDL